MDSGATTAMVSKTETDEVSWYRSNDDNGHDVEDTRKVEQRDREMRRRAGSSRPAQTGAKLSKSETRGSRARVRFDGILGIWRPM